MHAAGIGNAFQIGQSAGLYRRADDAWRSGIDNYEENLHKEAIGAM
jgi:hypothetical protein